MYKKAMTAAALVAALGVATAAPHQAEARGGGPHHHQYYERP